MILNSYFLLGTFSDCPIWYVFEALAPR